MEYLIGNFLLCLLYAVVIYGLLPFSTKKKNIVFGLITFIQLTIVHGFVDVNIMADLPSYKDAFDIIAKNGLLSDTTSSYDPNPMEPGYQLYMWSVSLVTSNFQIFLVINSIVLFYFYYKCFFNYSPYLWVSVLLFLLVPFNQSLFVLRQHLSISFLMLSYPFIIQKNFRCYVLILFISYLLHNSSLIFFPVYFIYNIKNKKIFICIIVAVFAVLSFANFLFEDFWVYFSRSDHFELDEDKLGISTKGVIMFSTLVLYIMSLKRHTWDDGINKLVFIISILGVVGNFTLGNIGHGRLFLSYYIILLLQIPITMKYTKPVFLKGLIVISSLSLFFIFIFFFAADASYWLFFRLDFGRFGNFGFV